jgi:hypothetical protein
MAYWLIFIVVDILLNWQMIRRGVKPIYLVSFFYRGITAILHGGLIMNVHNWRDYWPVFVFQTTSFWILFDLGLNLLRGKPWWYKGASSGYLDRIPTSPFWVLKLLAIGLLFAILLT